MAAMNTRSAPINAWFWFAENSVKFKVLIGAKNGELSKLAAVANINNTPATFALFLYEFIPFSSSSGAGAHYVPGRGAYSPCHWSIFLQKAESLRTISSKISFRRRYT
jgi:hypothetical protein